ncbi:MAG: CBS domain-containing protein, partial [Desulfovibrionaceae bacterium]|nr:CBS domain-containing protein [Desulfovibrionaceae bacterium]
GIGRLPIVDKENRVIGIISNTDIKEFSPQNTTGLEILELLDMLGETPVKQIMIPRPYTININNTVENAALLMAEKSVASLPVVDEHDKLMGIITEWDIFKIFINITGVREKGIQISFMLEHKPGTLRAKLDKLKEYKARVISVLSSITEDEMRLVTLRFRSTEPETEEALIKELSADGSVIYWGRGNDIHLLREKGSL